MKKKVRYLAGFAGLAPAAVGLAATGGAHAASAATVKQTPAKTVSLRHMTPSYLHHMAASSSASSSLLLVPTCAGSGHTFKDHNVIIEVCQKEFSSYVYWVNESVYYPTPRGITWRLHQRRLGMFGSNKVIKTYFLNAGTGWHKHKYFLDKTYRSETSFCVGADSTRGYPCCNITSHNCTVG
jgi:hypothetical protein